VTFFALLSIPIQMDKEFPNSSEPRGGTQPAAHPNTQAFEREVKESAELLRLAERSCGNHSGRNRPRLVSARSRKSIRDDPLASVAKMLFAQLLQQYSKGRVFVG
jgi:hypothetical protein